MTSKTHSSPHLFNNPWRYFAYQCPLLSSTDFAYLLHLTPWLGHQHYCRFSPHQHLSSICRSLLLLPMTANIPSFKHHIPLKHNVKYIYAVKPTAPNTAHFFRYCAHSAPSPGIGLGNIYMDIMPIC